MDNIIVTHNNVHIEDSYQYGKNGFQPLLEWIKKMYPQCVVFENRTMKSLCHEWAVHNFLYSLGLFRSHTKDVDLNWPIKKIVELAYNIIGTLVWPFIR